MAGLLNPRKNFRYLLELEGADAFAIQEISSPPVELTEVQHAAPGNIPNAKTPGKMTVGDLVVKKLKPANRNDNWAWEMMAQAATGLQTDFVRTGFLKEMSPDMTITAQSFFLGDVWVKKIEGINYVGQGSDNIIEEVTFAVQLYVPTNSDTFNAIFGGTAAVAAGQAFSAGQA